MLEQGGAELRHRITRRFFRNIVFLAFLCAIAVSGALMFFSRAEKLRVLQAELKQLEIEVEQAKMNVEGSQRMIEYAKNDEYLETLARSFGMVREGEIVFKDSKESE